MFSALFILVLLALGLSASAGSTDKAPMPPPSDDVFYQVPENLSLLSPGTILRHRPVEHAPSTAMNSDLNVLATHQIMYRTTDSHGNATATVMTVLVPFKANYSRVVSYQVAQNTAAVDCAPSYAFQLGSLPAGVLGSILTKSELLLISTALAKHWVVLVPDYLGPKAAFGANKLAGQAVLDGMRAAVRSTTVTQIDKGALLTMWGYSGGALASGWAAELHPRYAPELRIVGAAMGGLAPNVSAVVKDLGRTPHGGIVVAGLVGLANEFPAIDDILTSPRMNPAYERYFEEARTGCLLSNAVQLGRIDFKKMLNDSDIRTLPAVLDVMDQVSLGKAVPKIPLMMYHASLDLMTPRNFVNVLYATYCLQGGVVVLRKEILASHVTAAVTGTPAVLNFLEDVMSGGKVETCWEGTMISSLLERAVLKKLPGILSKAFRAAVGKRIGAV
ncbi:Lipase, secreted [Metarhizium album ARSEF 1941]|uniref:Lipase, secreted n=1 Tax=Metarhizium album (strain ARSEF 1941) TaxID=1081103 RepID=A0A0B2X7L4_METAS|nr:Lipase, secreted [Metarhizium album ARSEF 1941]KHO01505.1 Lipase, secreted [Metarhizium album ARSEF 1941]